MKKLTLFIIAAFAASVCIFSEEVDNKNWMKEGKTLYEGISGEEKKQKILNVDLNMHAGFNLEKIDSETKGKFSMREIRLEIKGQLTDWLSYRYRQRLNRSNNSDGNMDRLPTSIDVLGIGVKLSDKFSIFAGKQPVSYGGIEYDLNPIMVYEYSEIGNNILGFMTGINLNYKFIENHELQFQIVNSRIKDSVDDAYGVGFKSNSLPLLYSLNWNGNFNNVFSTRWSASAFSQAKNKQAYFFSLGNLLNLGKVNMALDFNYSTEDIDQSGVMTSITGGLDGHNAVDVDYKGIVYNLNYRLTPNWGVFGKGSLETASAGKTNENIEKGIYKTTWGYQAGIEYYPMEKSNLHFFLAYMGKTHSFKDRAKSFGSDNYNEDRIGVGFIYSLPVF